MNSSVSSAAKVHGRKKGKRQHNRERKKERGRGRKVEGVTEHCFSRAGRTKRPLCGVLREWIRARA